MNLRNEPSGLDVIIRISRWVGDPSKDLVILAEGNTSLKDADHLWVKTSGSMLGSAGADDFVKIDPALLVDLIERGTATDEQVASALNAAKVLGSGHPSVETLLHVVCQQQPGVNAVIHTHPTPVNSLLCSSNADLLVSGSYFPDQIVIMGRNPVLVPYVDPGLPLAHTVSNVLRSRALEQTGAPKIIYLRNHGMFALGRDAEEAMQITEMAVKVSRVILGAAWVGGAVPIAAELAERIDVRPDEIRRRDLLGRVGHTTPTSLSTDRPARRSEFS